MFLKTGCLISVILISYLFSAGQSGFNYDQEWKLIDSLINKKNLPKSALVEVNKVYTEAKKGNQEAQWVKAIVYKNHLQETDDRNIMQVVTDLEMEISSAPPRVAAILKSMEAEQLNQYLMENRYETRNRTAIAGDSSTDITTWTIDRMTEKIRNLYLSSLDIPIGIQKTPIDLFDPILWKGNMRELRPTVFDLLAWRALSYFQTDLLFQNNATDDSLMENPFLFSEASFFTHYDFGKRVNASNKLNAIRIYQRLLGFHSKDRILDAWIEVDISRMAFVYQYAGMGEKDSLYLTALDRIATQFPTLSITSRALFLEAQWWANQATSYIPLRDSLHRYDYLKAIAICEKTSQHSDSSEGKSNCELLVRNIKSSTFKIQSEEVNVPDQPFRLLVSYKNISNLYGRIIRIDEAVRGLFEQNRYDLKSWSKWIRLPFEKSFQQSIPETGDYQEHHVEIKIDGLPAGQYALMTSSDSTFSEKAILNLSTFFCSSIAFVNNDLDYFVVDRDSGHPLAGVKVKSFSQKYNNSENTFIPEKTYQTDLHGHFRLVPLENSNNLKLEFYTGKDYLSTSNYFNYYHYDEYDDDDNDQREFEKEALKDYFFTDRSIYRPGQTVYFKGLLITRDFKTRKYKPAVQQQTKIYLVDVNGQHIDSVTLKSNDFGSVQGNFKLPRNVLNGEFRISDETTGNEQTFSVEEYKRPTFYIVFDSLRESYQVGDIISLTGSTLAYAGNSIDDAKMSWRVYREARYPYPWLFRFYPAVSEQEIAHGESTTDENGKFKIRFTALADKSVSRSSKPVYSYRAETTITDGNGESRSETTAVSASYQSFEIVSSLPDEGRISADSLYQIPVTTQNASGVFVSENLTISLFPLSGPGRLIRKRYWPQPDQYVMTETEYIKAFPYDEYRDESNIKTWKTGPVIFQKTDKTRPDGIFPVGKNELTTIAPGWYLFEFRSSDKNGEDIIDKKYVEVIGNTGKSFAIAYNLFPIEEKTGEPGNSVMIQTGSDAKDLFIIRTRQSIPDTSLTYSFFNLNQQINSSPVQIRESDRGGFALNDIFIKNNRFYKSEHKIQVPWTNKELKISYQSWKDKTLPGSKEQWKINITGNKKDQVASEVLTSMYDASLDQFKMHAWMVPDIYSVYHSNRSWITDNNFNDITSSMRPNSDGRAHGGFQGTYDMIINFRYPKMDLQGRVAGVQVRGYTSLNDVVVTALGESNKKEKNQSFQPEADEKASSTDKNQKNGSENIQIRKNFNETAFFQPDLKTDAQGNVEINFTMPDALTKWKWMVLANTKDLSFGYSEKMVVTQKQLMVQTNMPRFFREGDTMVLPVKISNLSPQTMNGTVALEWMDAINNQNTDQALGNLKSSQPFTVNAAQSSVVFFRTIIPPHFTQPLLYRVIAKTDSKGTEYSDGEENIIPVLSNRMLVTESMPLNMDGKEEKHFAFDKLLKSNSGGSLQNQSLTVEYTMNPAWYAVQSLPYLMEFPYECAEQTFNRFYANALASHILQVSPAMQTIFEKWKNSDTAALLSNLQKNEELKTVLLRETPWVLLAQNEAQQKKNLALLFDLVKMRTALQSALDKLQGMQSESGGFPWFKGGRDDRYITQYIISGIGRLRKLKAIPADFQNSLNSIAKSGIAFLDREIKSDYEKREKSLPAQTINEIQIQWLYMRSFFNDISVPGSVFSAMNYYRRLSIEKWPRQSAYLQGMTALFLFRIGDIRTAKDILASLKENATNSVELGMYWKTNQYGYYWQEAPVETQSLLIEAFQELHAEQKTIDRMKFWLLQQKRTQHWPTTKSTADACYALLLSGSDWLSAQQNVTIQLGSYKISSSEEKTGAGTGYFKKQIPGGEVNPDMGNIQVTVSGQPPAVSGQRPTANPSWGAIYWQYFENLDKITSAKTQLSITKNLFIEKNSDTGPVLEAVSEKNILKTGDKLKMRIIIKSDRDLEYVHLKDMRAACLEPVNILSGYQYQGGLGYYETTQDASTSFFFDRLPKGVYVFEYPLFVTTAGNYGNGISSLECMYAPEFAAHSEGIRLQIESK